MRAKGCGASSWCANRSEHTSAHPSPTLTLQKHITGPHLSRPPPISLSLSLSRSLSRCPAQDFERGLDYFSSNVPTAQRRTIMHQFLQTVRGHLDAAAAAAAAAIAAASGVPTAPAPIALGVRLTPMWAQLRRQGLDELAALVAPVRDGGDGVTYINWGVFFFAYQPVDSELESLAAATPPGTPFYYETTMWTGQAQKAPGCANPATFRLTKEELWCVSHAAVALVSTYWALGCGGVCVCSVHAPLFPRAACLCAGCLRECSC